MPSLKWLYGLGCIPNETNRYGRAKSKNVRNLVDLNDDCLIAILEFLDVGALTSIAATCNRMYTIARIVFRRNTDFQRLNVFDIIEAHGANAPLLIKTHLKLFGRLIKTVTIDFSADAEQQLTFNPRQFQLKIITAIAACCTGTLDELHLHGVVLQAKLIRTTEPLFRHLKCLKLDLCDDKSVSSILAIGLACTELDIHGRMDESDLHNSYPNLERFTLVYRHDDFDLCPVSLERFLELHRQLKYVKLVPGCDFDLAVFQRTPNLEELEFHGNPYRIVQSARPFQQPLAASNLKRLTLNCLFRSAANMLNALPIQHSLEHLDVQHCCIDLDFIHSLCQLRELRSLKLSFMDNPSDFCMDQLYGLNELEEISLASPRAINGSCLVRLLRRVDGLKRLTFVDMGRERQINREVYRQLVAECRQKGKKLVIDYYRNGGGGGLVDAFNANESDCDFVEVCVKEF